MRGNPRTVLTSRSDTWLNVDDASTAGIRSPPENKGGITSIQSISDGMALKRVTISGEPCDQSLIGRSQNEDLNCAIILYHIATSTNKIKWYFCGFAFYFYKIVTFTTHPPYVCVSFLLFLPSSLIRPQMPSSLVTAIRSARPEATKSFNQRKQRITDSGHRVQWMSVNAMGHSQIPQKYHNKELY